MKRKSTLVDSVSAEPEVSAVGRNQQSLSIGKKLSIVNCALSIVNYPLSIVNCTLLIVFCLFFSATAWGQQELTIYGNGSATSSYVPVYGLWADAYLKCEYIIPANQLEDMDGGTITKMTFYASSPAAAAWTGTFQVFLEEVAETSISAYKGTSTATIVYEGALDGTGSTMDVNFTSPYEYGGGNLLVGFYQTVKGNYKSITFTGETVSGACVQGYSSSSLDAISANQRDFIPKTTFTYLTTDPYITLSPSSATVLTGFTQSLTASYGNVSGTPTITYTSSNTSVATVSGSGTSATVTAVAPGSATITASMTYQGDTYTATCAITVEDPSYCEPSFSNPSDDYISNFATSGGTTNINNTSTYVSSGYSDYYNNNSVSIEAGATLTCTVTSSSTQWSYGHAIWVDWNKDYEFTSEERVAYTSSTATGNWTGSFVVPANIAAGDYRMRVIHLYNDTPTDPCMSGSYGEAEDYKLTITSSCPAPSNFHASEVDVNSVTVEWSPNGGTKWRIMYTPADDINWVDADASFIISPDDYTYTITGLETGTTYKFLIFGYCGGDGSSEIHNPNNYSPSIEITATPSCPVPTNVHAGNLTQHTAQITWNGNADSYTVRYRTATITGTTLDPVFEDGFESGLTGWTTYARDYDDAITNWQQYDGTQVDEGNHTGYYVAASRSWYGSVGDQSVDNWLVSPQMTLGNTLKFWVATNNGFPDSYAVYVSTGSGVVPSSGTGDFEVIAGLTPATGTWVEQTYDISAFAGQQGYVAIRHKDYAHDHLFIDDFGVYNTINSYSYGTANTITPATSPCNITGLSAENLYEVSVQADCGGDGTSGWTSIYFTTPDACAAPTDLVSSNITSTTATLGWADNQDSYNLRYRKVYFYEGFEGETLPTGWTTIDANDDGNTWSIGHATAHSGSNGACNFSFIYNTTGTTPNDWLVSPQLDLQGTLRVWLSGNGIGGDQYSEHFQIYVSTTGNSAGDFTTTLVGETITGNAYVEYTADLSSYAGQRGYIAIRHFNCTDQNYLYVDDFGLYGSDNWTTINPSDATASLSNLSADTEYEWQVQGINCNGGGALTSWSATSNFTTLCSIAASVSPDESGSITGAGDYARGNTCTLTATADDCYNFVNWTENGTQVSTNATYSFTVTGNRTLVANFNVKTYAIGVSANPSAGGTVDGGNTYNCGATATLEATANTGYQFVNWTASNGSVVSANASYTFTVTGDVTYQANFTKTTVTQLPWTENFDNGYSCGTWEYLHGEWATPLRWTKAACVTNYSWGAYSDSYCMELRANNSDNLVVLPQFDQPLNKLKIKFQIGRGNTASGYTVKLGYVTDPSDASTFHELSTINTPSNPVASHTQYTCDLTTNNNAPSSSEYRLAIKYTTTNMEDSWYLDDFDVRRVYTIAVSDNPSSTASSLTGAGKYDHGATCTVSATAGDCYNFVNWTENGTEVSTSASYSFTAEADRNLVANFTQWTLNIDNTSLECINTGTEVVLTASATSNSTPTYEWAVSSGSTEGTASSNTYTVSPTALSNTYTVSATVGGCVVSESKVITVKPIITSITSSEGDDVCFGLTTELTANSSDAIASYSWNGGTGSGSPWTTPAITGTTNFTVVATGTNSCTVESTKSIGMKVPGNQPMTHAPEHGAIWTGYESADWSDVDNWVYFDGSYRALEGLSDTLNLILRTGDSEKCILNNPVINSPSFASNSGMIVRRPITIGEGTELNIGGDLNVESGSITLSSTGALLVTGNANIASGASVAFDNKDTLSIAGNLVLEGTLDFPESDTTPALRLGGNLVIDGGSIEEGGTLVFAGSGAQNVSNGATPLTLNNNVRLNMHHSRAGVPHTIFPDGTIFSKTTIFEYGIMDGDVTFNATGRTIVCGDYESYASGRITKIGAGNNFTFPTGDDNVLGSITAKINSGNTVHAKFHHNSADNGDGTHGFGLDVIPRWWNVADMCSDDPEPFNHVSNFEYWDISSPVELSNVILMANSATAAEHFHNPSEYTESDIQVAAFNNGCWGNFGGTAEISGSDHNVITITGAKIPKDPHRAVADFLITLGSKSHETLLPIELTSFTATCDGRSALVEWSTASERNNDYFSLERSDDAINFTEVARVAGAGNSIEPLDYAYNDYGIHGGDNYYRLVQVDYDGTRTVSEVIVANCIEPESDGEPEVLAYPNPFSCELTVVLDNFGNRAATIEVYDMLGKLIYTNKVASPQNSYETILNLSNLPPAAYMVRVSTTDFVINRNVVKN